MNCNDFIYLLAQLGATGGAFWGDFGALWGHLEVTLGHLGTFWAHFGVTFGCMRVALVPLSPIFRQNKISNEL